MRPVIVSLITCTGVLEHPTKAFDLFEVFDSIWGVKYPSRAEGIYVMMEVAEVRMPTRLSVEFVTADESQRVLAGKKVIDLRPDGDPLSCQRVAVLLPSVDIPAPGTYFVQVLLAGEILHKRRLTALVLPSKR